MALTLAVSNFSFQYWKDSPQALVDISVNVAPGGVCALLGPTNSGKTTLLQSIAGVLGSHHQEAIATGSISVGDEIFAPLPKHILFPIVGLTLQDPYYQISGLRETVLDEIALTLESIDIRASEIHGRALNLLHSLGLSHLAMRSPSSLSGGELQRVALANILIVNPPILLLDEPSHSLDGASLRLLASVLRTLRASTTVMVSDYQLEFALAVADQFVVMDRGRIVFSGDRPEFVDSLSEFQDLLPVDLLEKSLKALPSSRLKEHILRIVRNR